MRAESCLVGVGDAPRGLQHGVLAKFGGGNHSTRRGLVVIRLFAVFTVEILLPHRVEFGGISHGLSQRVMSPN